ncbi:ATP-dependent Clp protease proteolytic subunit, mitochondrial [Dirofilaria immitis]|nr:ATP-dependent Clp protease proteolytic subunit, mitochondrial [Dirofilaria immitis]
MRGLSFMRQLFFQRKLHSTILRTQTIPMVVDQDGRVERVYDIYSRLLKDRIVCVMTPINDQVAASIIAQLLFYKVKVQRALLICGSVTAGLGIYDTMQYISAPVATWCIGQAASMGSLLLSAGAKGMRTSLPNARIMVHQPSGGAEGQASDILIRAEEIGRLKMRLNKIYAMHTGQDIKIIEEALDRDRYMSPDEAKQFGIIDQIETSAFDI